MFNRTAGAATDECEETDFRKMFSEKCFKCSKHLLRDSIQSDSEEISFENLRCKAGPFEKKLVVTKFDLDEKIKRLLGDYNNLKHQKKGPSSNIGSKHFYSNSIHSDSEETTYEENICCICSKHFYSKSIHSDSEEMTFENLRCKANSFEKKLAVKEFDLDEKSKRLLGDRNNLKHQKKGPSSNICSWKNKVNALVLPSECPKGKANHYKKSVEKGQDLKGKILDMMNAIADHTDKTMKNLIESFQGKKIVNEEKIDKSRDIVKKISSLKKSKRLASSIFRSKNEENVLALSSKSPKEKSDHGVEKEMQTTADQALGNLNATAGRIVETIENVFDVLEYKMMLNQKNEIPRDVIKKIDEYTSASDDDDSIENDALPKPSQNFEKWLKKIRSDNKLRKALERFFMSYSRGITERLQIREKDDFHKALVQYLKEFSLEMSSKNPHDFFSERHCEGN